MTRSGLHDARAIEAGLAVFGHLHFVTFDLEARSQSVREVGIVFDDEDPSHGGPEGVGGPVATIGNR